MCCGLWLCCVHVCAAVTNNATVAVIHHCFVINTNMQHPRVQWTKDLQLWGCAMQHNHASTQPTTNRHVAPPPCSCACKKQCGEYRSAMLVESTVQLCSCIFVYHSSMRLAACTLPFVTSRAQGTSRKCPTCMIYKQKLMHMGTVWIAVQLFEVSCL